MHSSHLYNLLNISLFWLCTFSTASLIRKQTIAGCPIAQEILFLDNQLFGVFIDGSTEISKS
jgi:hypothetical protein